MKKIKAEGIRQRGAGSFEINFRPFRGGTRVQRIIHAGSIGEAKVKRAQMIAEMLKEKSPDQGRSGQSFEEIWSLVEKSMLAKRRKLETIDNYKHSYDRLFIEFRAKKYPQIRNPQELTIPLFVEYFNYYAVELNRYNGLRSEMARIESIMSYLRKLRYCSKEIMEELQELESPEANRRSFSEISHTDIKRFLLRIKNERPDVYGILYFIFRTGRRITETILIDRKDVEWGNKMNPIRLNIRAETTKTNKKAPLNFLDSDLQAHIRYYYQLNNQHKCTLLFLNTRGKRHNRGNIYQYLKSLSAEMGLPLITPHYFRHRFCTETCRAKLPLVDIMATCGIRDVQVLIKHYCHSSNEGQASVLEKTRL